MTDDDVFDWGVLGKDWWMENAEAVHASTNQAKFACARHMGCTRTRAAELAGYAATDSQGLRTAGSRADDTRPVQDLLTMASAASVTATDDPYTVAEARQKIGRMVKTSLDPQVVIKGTELLAKLDQAEKARGETPEDDGFGDWRLERDWIKLPNGGCSYLIFQGGHLPNLKLLHDTHHVVMKEPFGPELWSRFYALLNDDARAELDRELADSSFQHEARLKIWAEIGTKPPGPVDHRHLVRGPSADV